MLSEADPCCLVDRGLALFSWCFHCQFHLSSDHGEWAMKGKLLHTTLCFWHITFGSNFVDLYSLVNVQDYHTGQYAT